MELLFQRIKVKIMKKMKIKVKKMIIKMTKKIKKTKKRKKKLFSIIRFSQN